MGSHSHGKLMVPPVPLRKHVDGTIRVLSESHVTVTTPPLDDLLHMTPEKGGAKSISTEMIAVCRLFT